MLDAWWYATVISFRTSTIRAILACCSCCRSHQLHGHLNVEPLGTMISGYNACRNLRALLEELVAIAAVTKGKEVLQLDLLPVGDDFTPD